MNKSVAALLVTLAMIAGPFAWAQDKTADVTDMTALREAVRVDKKAYVASMLKLTDAEAKKFWPVYEAYQRELDLATRQKNLVIVDIVGSNKPISDLYARNLANELILADEIEIKARRTVHNRLIKPLPGRRVMPVEKGARYLQLESKIRAMQAYDVATTIPLIK
jgi:hypothetical protein